MRMKVDFKYEIIIFIRVTDYLKSIKMADYYNSRIDTQKLQIIEQTSIDSIE